MGQRHWVDISGAYASTSHIDNGKRGGTNGVDSTASIHLDCSHQSVKEVGQVSLHWYWG